MKRLSIALLAICLFSITSAHLVNLIGFYDYIVIGGGTSGSILAARLSEDSNKKVLLLTTGDDQSGSPYNQVPLLDPAATVNYPTDYVRFADPLLSIEGPNLGRRSNIGLSPRTLGGGSMVNGAVFQRVSNDDYAGLADLGITGWSTSHIDNLWKKIESYQPWGGGVVPPGHGVNGPVQTRAIPPEVWLSVAMNNYMSVIGTDFIPDMGLGDINGTGIFVRSLGGNLATESIGNYSRQDAYTTYLKPHLNRPNLEVLTGATVTRVYDGIACFKKKPTDACINGVSFNRNGDTYEAFLKPLVGEIILSAGALETPRILFHSGIGDCAALNDLGIECVYNNPQIGQNLYDHVVFGQVYAIPIPSPNWSSQIGSIVGTYYSANRTDNKINVETAVTSFPSGANQVILFSNTLTKPLSHGSVQLKDSDWSTPVNVSFGIMSNMADLAPLITLFKNTRRAMLESEGFPFVFEVSPGLTTVPLDASDAVIGAWLLRSINAVYHTVSTTPMGVCSSGATVDSQLRVCGVSNLRIADNGIFPYPYSGHTTDSGARIIGEQAAYLIRGH